MPSSTDRIEKKVFLKAPRSRVWKAISDAREFGSWFGVRLDGAFSPGAQIRGKMTPTTVDPEVAKMQKQYEGFAFDFVVDQIEPERLFSFRWHPYAIEPDFDYSREPMTLVVFTLEEVSGGTQLTVTETGFDKLPPSRRAKAFEMNEGGWAAQIRLLGKYVAS
ncbi:MAG: SRPBCC family protein [Myxococcales bacterium]|nr:SRPBCC family protein [Myxococcales bacterium]